MKLNKKLAGVLVATMVLSTMPQVAWASDYENHWAAEAINRWKDKGVINGFEDGTFRPKEAVTKAQFVKILVELFGYSEVEGAKQYKDVPADKWYSDYITKISAAGIMHEEGEVFSPNAAITREEAAYALGNAYKMMGQVTENKTFKDQGQISTWAMEAVTGLYEAGYIKGTPEGDFNPKGSLTRAEIVTMIDRINSEVINTKGTYSQDVEGNLVVNTRDVVLKDMTITGNLYLAEGIGDGDIDLENVKVEGKMFVEGGGINSIKSKNCHYAGSVQVSAKNPVRVVVEGDGIRIEALEGTQVTLTGNFTQVTVAQDVSMIIKDATVETVVIAKGTKEDAAAPKIEITAGTKVDKIQADTAATITGTGKIGELIVNTNDVKVEQKPDKVTIGEKDVTVNVAGKDQSQSTTDKVSGGGGGGGSTTPGGSTGDTTNPGGSTGDISEELAPTYRISGTVYAQQKVGEQLKDVAEGANISFYEITSDGDYKYIKNTYTDNKGAYSINLESGKTYSIQVWLEDADNNGYFYTQTLNPLKQNLDAFNLTIEQFPVANITVVDLDNRPVQDVKIVPIMNGREDGRSDTWYDGNAVRYLWGDDETVFNFDVYLGDTKVEPVEAIKDITVGEVKEQYNYRKDLKVQLPFTIPSTVTGQLVLEDGEILKNYPVQLVKRQFFEDENGWATKWVNEIGTKTDDEGNFTFENVNTNLEKGEYYTLSVKSRAADGNSYNAENSSLSLYALQANNGQIKLQQTYGVIVKVVDKEGKPVKSARVELSAASSNGNYSYSINTDNQGLADINATYIEPINNTLVVSYNGETVVTHVEMTPGNYNYEKVVQLENTNLTGKVVRIQLDEMTTTVGNQTIKAKQVGIQSNRGSYSGLINASGEAMIILPEDYNEDLELYVLGENNAPIYREKMSVPEKQFNKTIKLSDVPAYAVTGQVLLSGEFGYEATTGAMIEVKMDSWTDAIVEPVITTETTENGFELPHLLASSSYIVTARYEKEGVQYIGRIGYRSYYLHEKVDMQKQDKINLVEAEDIRIQIQDSEGNVAANQRVYINGERFTTDRNGNIVYEAELGKRAEFQANVVINDKNCVIKQIKNTTNNTAVEGSAIELEKDMNLVVIVG